MSLPSNPPDHVEPLSDGVAGTRVEGQVQRDVEEGERRTVVGSRLCGKHVTDMRGDVLLSERTTHDCLGEDRVCGR